MTRSGHGGDALRMRDAQGEDEAPAIDEIRRKLRSLRIEIKSAHGKLGHDYLADALIQAVDTVLQYFFPHVSECEEAPDSVKYASGVGSSWIRTTYCWGRVQVGDQKYHVYVEYTQGYNSSKSEAQLNSIELIQHNEVIGDD